MKTKLIHAAILVAVLVTGCATMTTDQAIVPLQTETAKILGLASSDELTVTNVRAGTADSLGGQDISYVATTTKGRKFDCTARMMPGVLLSAPTLSAPSCHPIKTHD
ncbi:hypothetical protein [Luteimonas panaciterrae]|uniref:hypothetical protein n=1 Tax=Luteimonas panaciterrae TaxID=363885 RepID=UPI001CFBF974|nr:hypothetical protein [Luteimonas panaciterrae]